MPLLLFLDCGFSRLDVSRFGSKVKLRHYPVVVEPDGDGYHAYCPALPGLHAAGDTEDAALEGARAASIAYLRSIVSHGDPIPVGPDCEIA